jgi:hypothetical protein
MQRPVQRLSILSFGFLLIFSAAIAVFVHQISPLRDTNFQPNSGNAGSLIPWLRGVRENAWLQGAYGLAGLFAVSLVLVLRQWSQALPPRITAQSQNALSKIAGFLFSIRWIAIGVVLSFSLWWAGISTYVFHSVSNLGTVLIAFLVAIHFTFVFWLWNQLESLGSSTPWHHGIARKIAQGFLLAHWVGIGLTFFRVFQLIFMGYLMVQWLVD